MDKFLPRRPVENIDKAEPILLVARTEINAEAAAFAAMVTARRGDVSGGSAL